jgi:hypothetical protein
MKRILSGVVFFILTIFFNIDEPTQAGRLRNALAATVNNTTGDAIRRWPLLPASEYVFTTQ